MKFHYLIFDNNINVLLEWLLKLSNHHATLGMSDIIEQFIRKLEGHSQRQPAPISKQVSSMNISNL